VALLARTWLGWARARRRLTGVETPREQLIKRYAPGRSFADVGAIWSVHGAMSFVAEESGATSVTALDIMTPTPEYEAEHARRGSAVRFVRGDVHKAGVIGPHQVVWCAGVLYHAPNPLLTLERLGALAQEVLIIATETIPEVPGVDQACVFLPCLPDGQRRAQAFARPGIVALGLTTPFTPGQSYGAWWWGISRSALYGMVRATGLEVLEEHGDALHATVVCRPLLPES
jgi:hypothetical protein